MGLGSIVGTGVFVSLGIATGVVGTGVVPAVALAALVATANGLSSAQLAAAHPVSGGTYEYGHKFLHPWAGFAAGWMFLAAKSASAATAALGFSGYLLHALGWSSDPRLRLALALGLVLLLTGLARGGLQRSNRGNIAIVSLTLGSLLVFVVAGLMSTSSQAVIAALTDGWSSPLNSPDSFLQAVALMFVAYTGYGRIATLGEEVAEPARTIPRAIVATLVLSMGLYLSVATVAVATAGAAGFADATTGATAPLEVVARGFHYSWAAQVVSLGAVTAMAGVLLNLILGLSRVLFAMARRGEVPAPLAEIEEETQSPARAVLVMGAVIAGLVMVGDVKTTWSFSAFTVLIYYGITNLCALYLPPESRRFPRLVAVLGLLSCFGLAFFVEGRIWAAGTGLLIAGFALRAFFVRGR